MGENIREEHIRKFKLESRRVHWGLKPESLPELVYEVLEYTDDTALCAILADLPIMTNADFLNDLLEFLDKSYEHDIDMESIEHQVEAEFILSLCTDGIPPLEEIQKTVSRLLDSNRNYTKITIAVFPQFEQLFELLDAESDKLSWEEEGPWYKEAFGSTVFDISHAHHLAHEVAYGVHQWSPVWEDELPKWISGFRTIIDRLEGEMGLSRP